MNFELTPALTELRARARAFVEEAVIPREAEVLRQDAAGERTALLDLREQARARGLLVPHLPPELGGQGLGPMGMGAAFRELGRSLVGPAACLCDAPDQGNMDLLQLAATPAQRERWLLPLCRGELTSAFCLTEPAPGAGADPGNLRTRARPDGDGWRLEGHKWYATGAAGAAVLLVVARTADDALDVPSPRREPRRGAATVFLVDRHAPGVELVREIETLGEPFLTHREAELRFRDVRLGPGDVLGQVGQGFDLVQRRLVPARLTHCMRWLGLADRALGLCRDYLNLRESFGRKLGEHQQVQVMIHRGVEALHAADLVTWRATWLLEQGREAEAKPGASLAKTMVARALCQVLDDAIQMHGALGYSQDLPFAGWWRHARAARIADGPDEVHVSHVAREFLHGRVGPLV